jgi:HK97 family phage major capsid protein/HK97 family phage prohead protease
MHRAYSLLEVKAIEEDIEYWTVKGVATTPTPDRLNDVIEPLGASYQKEIPLLWQHDRYAPVGITSLGKATKKGIPFEARLPKVKESGTLRDRIEEAVQSMKYRLVSAVSIGFRVIDDAMEFLDNGGILFQKTEIMELSLVTIPAQMEATITSVKSLDQGVRAALGKPHAVKKTTDSSAGASAPTTRKETKMKVGEQITAFESRRTTAETRMEAIMEKAGEEDRTLDAAEQEEYDTLVLDVDAMGSHLKRLRALETAQALKSKTVTGGTAEAASQSRDPVITAGHDILPKGMEFARYARCLILAKGNLMQAHEIAKQNFPDNPRVHNVLKAAVSAGTTSDPTWAAPLVDYQRLADEFIEFLRPQTIIGQFGVGGVPSLRRIPFNVRMGRQTSGGSGYWVGQGAAKPLTKFDYDDVTLRWAKVANIAVITEELARFSNPSADGLVRQALADALRERMDIDFVDPDKAEVTNISPASIINGVTPITSSGTSVANARTDIAALIGAFVGTGLPLTTGVFIGSTATALALSMAQNALGQPAFPGTTIRGGTLSGLSFIVSEYMTQLGDSGGGAPLILVNASDVFLADDGQFTIDASREASLEMSDAPTGTSVTPTGTSLVSMFQTNSIALKAERFVNWKKRREGAAQWIDNANYGT